MAQWLRALPTISEDLSSVLGTHVKWLTAAYNSSSRESDFLFWTPRVWTCTYLSTYSQIDTYHRKQNKDQGRN